MGSCSSTEKHEEMGVKYSPPGSGPHPQAPTSPPAKTYSDDEIQRMATVQCACGEKVAIPDDLNEAVCPTCSRDILRPRVPDPSMDLSKIYQQTCSGCGGVVGFPDQCLQVQCPQCQAVLNRNAPPQYPGPLPPVAIQPVLPVVVVNQPYMQTCVCGVAVAFPVNLDKVQCPTCQMVLTRPHVNTPPVEKEKKESTTVVVVQENNSNSGGGGGGGGGRGGGAGGALLMGMLIGGAMTRPRNEVIIAQPRPVVVNRSNNVVVNNRTNNIAVAKARPSNAGAANRNIGGGGILGGGNARGFGGGGGGNARGFGGGGFGGGGRLGGGGFGGGGRFGGGGGGGFRGRR